MIPTLSLGQLGIGSANFEQTPVDIDPFYPTLMWSMAKRNASYSGYCCRVKNWTTSTETDIPFGSDGWCSEAALLATWASGQTVGLTKLYDGAGGSVDIAQTTVSKMPFMVNSSGVVQKMAGRVCPYWADANGRMELVANAALGFGTSPWTVEFYASAPTIDTGHYNELLDTRTTTGAGTGLFVVTSTYKLGFYDGTLRGASGTSVVNGTVNHIAWCYDGTTLYHFLNGNLESSQTLAIDFTSTRPAYLGNGRENDGSEWPGYIGECLITKGTCKWTASFTPRSYT